MMMMDLTMEAATAVPTAGQLGAPVNQFAVMTEYPDASFRAVARTGLDTLFATAWADLDEEPLVLSVPDTDGRYYVIALFDMWSNVFASIGSRTTGTDAGQFLIAGPDWHGTPPNDVRETYRSPTRFVWVNGQMRADGPKDYGIVNPLQKQYKLTPLSKWGHPYTPPAEVPVTATEVTGTQPLERIRNMDAGEYFGRLASLLKDNPPLPGDGPMLEDLRQLGIEAGEDFDINAVGTLNLLEAMLAKGVKRIVFSSTAPVGQTSSQAPHTWHASRESPLAAPDGQASAQAPWFVQLPNASASIWRIMSSARSYRSGCPCGSRFRCAILAPVNSIADALGQAATQGGSSHWLQRVT